MQPELIDEWDVPSKDIEGLVFHVRVEYEPESTPYDYGPESAFFDHEVLQAWERNEWWFVYTEVTPEYKGILVTDAANGLGGTEWGAFPGVEPRDDRDYFTNVHPLPDYILPEVIENLRGFTQRGLPRAHVRSTKRAARQKVKSARREAKLLRNLRKALED